MSAFVSLSFLSFLASSVSYLSHGHFAFPRSSSPTLSFFSSPLLAAVSCAVVLPQNLFSLPPHMSCTLPCLVLASLSSFYIPAKLLVIRVSGHFDGVAFRACLTTPMTAVCGNMTVTRDTARARKQMCESTGICFFTKNCLVPARVSC